MLIYFIEHIHWDYPAILSLLPSTLYDSKKESLAGGQHYSFGMLNHHTSKRKRSDLVTLLSYHCNS